MPTYEYACSDCGHRFERFQPISEDPVKICPECEGSVKRLISGGAGVIFKGSGFYITDYRSDSYKAAEKKDKSDSTTSSSSSSDSSSKSSDSSSKSSDSSSKSSDSSSSSSKSDSNN